MAEVITPKKNPFFAGPQTGARPRPIQPRPMQPRPGQQPIRKPGVKPPSPASQNKKVFMIAGIIVAVLVVGVILYFLLATFGGEFSTKL